MDLLKRRQSYNEFEELIEKKRELRERMMTKILLLREERDVLLHEKKANDNQGQSIMKTLESLGTSQEVEKYRKFLDEIEQITKLTVSLTIRLSRLTKRIENSQLNCDAVIFTPKPAPWKLLRANNISFFSLIRKGSRSRN